jgi:hypothetical protein
LPLSGLSRAIIQTPQPSRNSFFLSGCQTLPMLGIIILFNTDTLAHKREK